MVSVPGIPWELRMVSPSPGCSALLLFPYLGDKVSEEKADQDGQRHEDHLGHADLPEKHPKGDFLGVLDQHDGEQDKQDGHNQEFCFHHIHLFLLKNITIVTPIASIIPTMTKYPHRHSSSGICLKFMP